MKVIAAIVALGVVLAIASPAAACSLANPHLCSSLSGSVTLYVPPPEPPCRKS